MGAPSKLTPAAQELIIKLLKAGNYLETAAASAGVGSRGVRYALRKGVDEQRRRDNGEVPDRNLEWEVQFAAAATKAMSDAEARAVALMAKAAEKDWRAAMTFLERKFPHRWGEKINVTVKEELDAALERLEKALPPEWFEVALKAIAGEDTGDTGDEPAPDTRH